MEKKPSLSNWRGLFGIISPTFTAGSLEELIRMLPGGLGVLQIHNDLQAHTRDEFERVIANYEAGIKKLADQGCNLICPSGAPPFMVLGAKKEAALLKTWEKKYGVPLFTASNNHVTCLRALGIKKMIAATYNFGSGTDKLFHKYLLDSGFKVLDMPFVPLDANFASTVSMEAAYSIIRRSVFEHPDADGILLIGGGWRDLRVINLLERDTGLPVVHHVAGRAWEILKRFRIQEPKEGYGRLLRDLPEPATPLPPVA